MIEVIGGVFVLFGTTAFGIHKSCVYMNRLHNLYEVKKAFLYIQAEIRYMNTPMPEILEGVSRHIKGPICEFFEKTAESLKWRQAGELKGIWEECFTEYIFPDMLEKEAREEFFDMGGQLGCLDRQAQEKAIDYFLDKWEFVIEKRRAEKSSRLRLYYACGVMSGILMIIMLV